jgi:HNH endonuclease
VTRNESLLSIEHLRKQFEYRADGSLIRKSTGKVADCQHKRRDKLYCWVYLNNKRYESHRVVWALCKGQWPTNMIDHVNRVGTDNKIDNLREANYTGNARNATKPNRTTGFRGVKKNKQKFLARICVEWESITLGNFSTVIEAAQVYNEAAKKYHGAFAVLNEGCYQF